MNNYELKVIEEQVIMDVGKQNLEGSILGEFPDHLAWGIRNYILLCPSLLQPTRRSVAVWNIHECLLSEYATRSNRSHKSKLSKCQILHYLATITSFAFHQLSSLTDLTLVRPPCMSRPLYFGTSEDFAPAASHASPVPRHTQRLITRTPTPSAPYASRSFRRSLDAGRIVF